MISKEELYHLIPGIETVCIFDNNNKQNACGYRAYEWLGGFGVKEIIIDNEGNAFEKLHKACDSEY